MVRHCLVASVVIAAIGWTNSLAAQSDAPENRNGRPVGEIGALPPLPAFPKDLEWPNETKETLERVIADYPNDQVSAYLAFDETLQRQKDKLAAKQQDWLQRAADAIRDRVARVLKRDFDIASRGIDLHAMHVVVLVANKVNKDMAADMKAAFDKAKAQVIEEKKVAAPLWKVTNVKGELLDDFSEGGFDRITLTPKDGGRLLRVKARIENVSETFDVPYATSALRFGDFNSGKEDIKGPAHIIQDNFIFVLAGDGTWIPCDYVCEGCKPLRGFSAIARDRDSGRGFVLCGGTCIPKGGAFDLDVVFSVPKTVGKTRLLVLGSAPVP